MMFERDMLNVSTTTFSNYKPTLYMIDYHDEGLALKFWTSWVLQVCN